VAKKKLGIIGSSDILSGYKNPGFPIFNETIHLLQEFADDGYELHFLVPDEFLDMERPPHEEFNNELSLLDADIHYSPLSDSYDLLFFHTLFVSKERYEQLMPMVETVMKNNPATKVVYWDQDDELSNKGNIRVSVGPMLLDKYGDQIVYFTSSYRGYSSRKGVHYLPLMTNRKILQKLRKYVDEHYEGKKYTATFIGGLTGRAYVKKVCKMMRESDEKLPLMLACPYYDKLEMLQILGGKENLVFSDWGRVPRQELAKNIAQSRYHVHGGGWFSPRVRPENKDIPHPPYYTMKVAETIWMSKDKAPLLLTLDFHDRVAMNIPDEVVFDWRDPDISKALALSESERQEIINQIYDGIESYTNSSRWYSVVKSLI